MNNSEIKKYLNYLNFKKFYKPTFRSCEICDSMDTKVFIRKISWNINKFEKKTLLKMCYINLITLITYLKRTQEKSY